MAGGGTLTPGRPVVVVGAGNAALSAAVAAADAGAPVVVLEKAPEELRGGNTRFTGALFRMALDDVEAVRRLVPDLTDEDVAGIDMHPYPAADFYADVMRLSSGWPDPELVGILADRSFETTRWLTELGVRFQLYPKYIVRDGKRSWPDHAMLAVRDGGQGLSAALFEAAAARGVEIRYSAAAHDLVTDGTGRVEAVAYRVDGVEHRQPAAAVVLGSGGFEASTEMRVRYLGPPWDMARVRGTRFNTGEMLDAALRAGAQSAGHWSAAHAVPVDAFAPDVGDLAIGASASRTSYMFGIMVNRAGHRFVDEGSDFKLYTYARTGREILLQPGSVAYQIFDQQVIDDVLALTPGYRRELDRDLGRSGSARAATLASSIEGNPVQADTIEELADRLRIDRGTLAATVRAYNEAVQDGDYNPTALDHKATRGIEPPKSNWALPLVKPPFLAYMVTCGITFSYGGVRVDGGAHVVDRSGRAVPNLFATGEITGGFFYHNYPAGAGLMRGSVFGRIAGEGAAAQAAQAA